MAISSYVRPLQSSTDPTLQHTYLFTGEKKTSKLVQLLHGDEDTVNVVTGHPYEPQLAVSGIDHTVKIFSPDQLAQVEFLGVERQYRPRNSEVRVMGIEIDEEPYTEGSRRRLEDEYRIRSQNETMRETGVHEALVTVSEALRALF